MAAPDVKKLIILDVNGLLVATYHKDEIVPAEESHAKVGNFFVYKRPGCEEFLNFCFENFIVGIWSSAREHNVNSLVDYIFKDLKPALAFSWHQRHCTKTEVMHPDNKHKPIFLKELSKLWATLDSQKFGPTNSLLVDDSPYKALKNPPHTGIFPRSYTADAVDDNFLETLCKYLEGVRDSADVQKYVRENPIGEPSITTESPSWNFFSSILTGGTKAPNVVQGFVGTLGFSQQSRDLSNQLQPEGIECQDMYSDGKRRQSSPSWVARDRKRIRGQNLQEQEHVRNTGESRSRHDTRNGHEPEYGRGQMLGCTWRQYKDRQIERNREQERERSRPELVVGPYNNYTSERERESSLPEFVVGPYSNYTRGRIARRDASLTVGWNKSVGFVDTPLSRDHLGGQSSEQHRGRAMPSQVGRGFIAGAIDERDLRQREPEYGHVPPSMVPPRSWSSAEEQVHSYGNFLRGTQFAYAPPNTRTGYDNRWQEPMSSIRTREYDSRWSRAPLNQYTAPPSRPRNKSGWDIGPSDKNMRSYHLAQRNEVVGPHNFNPQYNRDAMKRYRHSPYTSSMDGVQ